MRNAEATRERILEAAMDEFSTFGIAGARVDRIARTAGCNKNLIYIYFENKETLFTTVLQKHLDQAFEGIPFSVDDIPGFAVTVFDFAMANPKIMRLLMWYTLEQNTVSSLPVRDVAHERKIDKISEAQANGRINSALPPAFLLTSIMTIATSWAATNPFGPGLNPDAAKNQDALRESVVKAVELLLQAK